MSSRQQHPRHLRSASNASKQAVPQAHPPAGVDRLVAQRGGHQEVCQVAEADVLGIAQQLVDAFRRGVAAAALAGPHLATAARHSAVKCGLSSVGYAAALAWGPSSPSGIWERQHRGWTYNSSKQAARGAGMAQGCRQGRSGIWSSSAAKEASSESLHPASSSTACCWAAAHGMPTYSPS